MQMLNQCRFFSGRDEKRGAFPAPAHKSFALIFVGVEIILSVQMPGTHFLHVYPSEYRSKFKMLECIWLDY